MLHTMTSTASRPSESLTIIGALPPQHMPGEQSVRDALAGGRFPAVLAHASVDAIPELERIVGRMPDRVPDRDTKSQVEDAAHDDYFRIERVAPSADAFIELAYTGRLLLLHDVLASVPTSDRALVDRIDRSLVDLLSCMAGGRVGDGVSVTEWTSTGTQRAPLDRWVRGHQIFVVLTQGLVFAFRAMAAALKANETDDVSRWADLAASLLDGSQATFQFTGEFSTEEYNDLVRPSMMPPHTPFCLSGMMSVDHRYFVTTVRDMKPALKALHTQDSDRHVRIAAALRSVYDSHIHTCERFVGNQPSIMTEGKTEKSGVSLLEHFRTIRLRPFAEADVPQRLKAAAPAPSHASAPAGCPFHK